LGGALSITELLNSSGGQPANSACFLSPLGRGGSDLSRDHNPSPHPSPYGRGSRPNSPLERGPPSEGNVDHCWYYAIVRASSLYAIGDELDQHVRRDRRLPNAHPERLQRVLDGGDHRGRGRNGADLAGALAAERIERRRRLFIQRLNSWHFGGTRQEVIGEARGERLAGRVVSHPFQHGIAEAMRHAAAYLAIDQHGIDQDPRVLQRHVVQKLDAAGVGIDLDLRDMA